MENILNCKIILYYCCFAIFWSNECSLGEQKRLFI